MSGSAAGRSAAPSQVTVVVVTYQAVAFVDDCLQALRDQTLPAHAYRVVVVDNASTDGTPDLVRQRHPWVTLVASGRNLGFGGGCELGRRHAPAEVVVLVNPDARVAPDFLREVLAPLDDPGVGAVTGRVVLEPRFVPAAGTGELRTTDGRTWRALARGEDHPDAVDVVNSTGNEVTRDGYGYDRGYLQVGTAHTGAAEVFGFCGAAAALRSAAVDQVGGFDVRYFLYYEDTDLSWRLRLAGWKVVHAPGAVARHRHQASVGRGSRLHLYHGERNRLVTLAKNAPAGTAWRAWLRHPLTTVSLARRELPRTGVLRTRVRAYLAAAALLPITLRARTGARRDRTRRAVVDGWVRGAPSSAELHHG